ncbi:MAG TPA: hypothetical protein PLJ16_02645 [Casimicrobium huifangae]|jgi:hypothetical protein|uniref:hypothetical protein n=1 Tax=Casimicrobium huifangae TaxID=2591109 RepID=UPI0012EC1F41|nr:hypothetical protein [Casimicrobium huifangae]HOB02377.1 hypothetical protein [Casimicrobium huifangae]HQA33110.1 hypothetical protein [Casimicrobium huifangae]HQD64098.1 hypothetical protein [Casimicrobium huifangae]
MLLANNTPQQLFYSISNAVSADCGSINAGDTASLPYYDNQTNVQVGFSVNSTGPNATPFTIVIPSTGTGKAVTLGLYVE